MSAHAHGLEAEHTGRAGLIRFALGSLAFVLQFSLQFALSWRVCVHDPDNRLNRHPETPALCWGFAFLEPGK